MLEPKGYFITDTASAHPHALLFILQLLFFIRICTTLWPVYVTFLQEIIKQEALEEKQKNLLLVD